MSQTPELTAMADAVIDMDLTGAATKSRLRVVAGIRMPSGRARSDGAFRRLAAVDCRGLSGAPPLKCLHVENPPNLRLH